MKEFGINTVGRQTAFLAQVGHEKRELRFFQEFGSGKQYDPSVNPKLAARLGNTEVGDGAFYKGRGPIQITGRSTTRQPAKPWEST